MARRGRRHAALRADEAGRPDRPPHGSASLRRRSAAPGEPGARATTTWSASRRSSRGASRSGSSRMIPGLEKARLRSPRARFTATPTSTPRPISIELYRLKRSARACALPARSPASRATSSRRRPGLAIGLYLALERRGVSAEPLPGTTALGALSRHLVDSKARRTSNRPTSTTDSSRRSRMPHKQRRPVRKPSARGSDLARAERPALDGSARPAHPWPRRREPSSFSIGYLRTCVTSAASHPTPFAPIAATSIAFSPSSPGTISATNRQNARTGRRSTHSPFAPSSPPWRAPRPARSPRRGRCRPSARFFRFACREGARAESRAGVPDAKTAAPRSRGICGRARSRTCSTPHGDEPLDARDRAILELLYATGLRVGELVSLDWDNIDMRGTGPARPGQRRQGADGSVRHATSPTTALARGHFDAADEAPRQIGDGSDPVFLNFRGGRLSDRSVRRIIDETSNGRPSPPACIPTP